MPNNPGDIFGQYRFLDHSIFGKYWTHFTSEYAVRNPHIPNKIDRWVKQDIFHQKVNRIRHHIGSDVLVLPERQEIDIEVELSPAGRKAYMAMRKEALLEIRRKIEDEGGQITEKMLEAIGQNGAVQHLRLLQLAQGYVTTIDHEEIDTDTEKRKALCELLEQTDEPVCVYGWFRHDLAVVKRCCELLGKRFGEVSGSRKDLTENGKYPDNVDVLGVQCKSGGAGIDLTKSRIGIILNSGLISPGDYDQMMARQYRPGQTKNVIFYHLLSIGTVDMQIRKARAEKRDVVRAVLDGIVSGERSDDMKFMQQDAIRMAMSFLG
jgi:SNF2 family DNA or RNA helicase